MCALVCLDLDYLRGVFGNECTTFFPEWRSKSLNDKLNIMLNANPASLKDRGVQA